VSDGPEPEEGSAEHRADLTGLSRLSDQPPPPKGERAIRVARGMSILLLAIAAAGLPWYLVTRGNGKPVGAPTPSPSKTTTPSPTPSLVPGTYEVVGVGNCLNIREGPSTSAVRIDCLTKGFRVRSDGQTQSAEGRQWRRVYDKLKKVWGWAADQYLKRV